MKAARTKPEWRRIKTHRNYTVEEVARAVGVAKGTVRRWIARGLPSISDKKPILLLGADLIEFHRNQKAPKQRCKPHECYCVKCRVPRVPAANMAEYVTISDLSGNLRAICPVCDTLMHRRTSLAKLAALSDVLDISIPHAIRHLVDWLRPSSNDDLSERP